MSVVALEPAVPGTLMSRAVALDRADSLASLRDEFIQVEGIVARLDGNTLGTLPRVTAEPAASGWNAGASGAPVDLGDRIGRVVLGAAPGQTIVGDSAAVLLHALVRTATAARPGRDVIVADRSSFDGDRLAIGALAAEHALELRWIDPALNGGVTEDEVRAVLDERVVLVALSHVAPRSGYVTDMAEITVRAHDAGALVLWDVCHSAGAVGMGLDRDGVDLALGCTHGYLGGGPGAPAFAYVAAALQAQPSEPIQAPSTIDMLPVHEMLGLIERVGVAAIREKSLRLTEYALGFAEERLMPLGALVASPRKRARRGSHIALEHRAFESLLGELRQRGVIVDFQPSAALRIGLAPLSTSFVEVARGLSVVEQLLRER